MKAAATVLISALLLTACATTSCPSVESSMRAPIKAWDNVASWSPYPVNVAAFVLAVPVLVGTVIACRVEAAGQPDPVKSDSPVDCCQPPADRPGVLCGEER